MIPVKPICLSCANYIIARSCFAFPDEIPDTIWLEGEDHNKPRPGDHDIQFEPIEDKAS